MSKQQPTGHVVAAVAVVQNPSPDTVTQRHESGAGQQRPWTWSRREPVSRWPMNGGGLVGVLGGLAPARRLPACAAGRLGHVTSPSPLFFSLSPAWLRNQVLSDTWGRATPSPPGSRAGRASGVGSRRCSDDDACTRGPCGGAGCLPDSDRPEDATRREVGPDSFARITGMPLATREPASDD